MNLLQNIFKVYFYVSFSVLAGLKLSSSLRRTHRNNCKLEPELSRGFTIIEIMVAVLLLSSALVAIFAVQFAAIKNSNYARNITQATQLGKCKMSELELLFIEEGFQEGSLSESGECCEFIEGESFTEFECTWDIETVVFPDMTESLTDEDADGMMDEAASGLDGGSGGLSTNPMLSGASEDMASMGLDMISSFMPMVTELLEQAIRRVTVKVTWKEGIVEKEFELVQYVTHPTQGPLKLMQEAAAIEELQNQMMGN